MRTRSLTSTRGWFGVVAIAATYFMVGALAAPLLAQTAILGELEFKGASKVERSSGVWIDGQYLGYMDELRNAKRVLLLPGDHELTVRQAGYRDFTEKLTVEPKELLLVPVKMQRDSEDTYPKVTSQLKVDVQPDRAAVFVDERFLGHAGELGGAFHSMLLSPGTHQIKVELPGYQTFETSVTLVAGQKGEVKTSLRKGSIHQADALIDQANNIDQNK
jgi:PEGA domain